MSALLGIEVLVLLLIMVVPAAGGIYYFFLSPAARNRRKMRERMKKLVDKAKNAKRAEAAETRETRLRRDEEGTALDRLARRVIPNPAVLRRRLEATGKNITIGRYFLLNVMVAAAAGSAFWMFTDLPGGVAPLIGLPVGVFVPHKAVNMLIAKRQQAFLEGLTEALDMIVRGVKSGLPVAETINSVAEEMEGPIAQEFKRVTEDMRVGMTLEQALWASAGRANVPEFKFFVVVLSVQRETGGNLSETLENLSELVRSRRQMKLKVKAMSSEARASQYILGGLPFAIAGLLLLVSPDYILTLWRTEAGHTILLIAGTMLSIGWYVMGRMVNFEI